MKYHFHCASTSQESPERYNAHMKTTNYCAIQTIPWYQSSVHLGMRILEQTKVFFKTINLEKNTFSFSFLLIFKTYLCDVASIQFTLSNGFVPKVNITPLLHQETTSALWCQQANNVCNNVMQNKMLYVWWYDHMMFYGIPWFFVLWEEVCATTYVHPGWSQILKMLSVLTQLVLVCLYRVL